jgi:AcrR family transcriptional regulator
VATGLRERKKLARRRLIADTAMRLFTERGFDAVTVAEIARAADVSEGTVFNYFPAKEDLFYDGMAAFETELLDAVRERAPGESVLSAFRDHVLAGAKGLDDPARAELIATAAHLIAASPALRRREREIAERTTDALAAILAEQAGARPDDVEPLAVAGALMAVQRALRGHVHTSVLRGQRGPALRADVRAQARRAFGRLEAGLGDYGAAPAAGRSAR